MRTLLQDLRSGKLELVEGPAPIALPGTVVVNSRVSLVSAGTERMLLEFGRANLAQKARQQPEKVKLVLEKVRTDGVMPTLEAVRSKLAQPIPLGYSNVGVVVDVGAGVTGLEPGDRVVSNGPHAEVVRVPRNLCARIPDEVPDETASFTVVASIGLQGVRLVAPTLGETVVVIGTGLIGLLTIQMLVANGCRVLAIDLDPRRLKAARRAGALTLPVADGVDPEAQILDFTNGHGADAVIITAATSSNEPVRVAARVCRVRGRIVLVGVSGLDLKRDEFYRKELTFQVSCSYGPGRYDRNYEEKGQDYPMGHVRWTEQRNFEAVLRLMADGRVRTDDLVTHRFTLLEAPSAYDVLGGEEPSLGILLQYDTTTTERSRRTIVLDRDRVPDDTRPVVSVIGGGNYASRVLIPALKQARAQLHTLATTGGSGSSFSAHKAGFSRVTSDVEEVIADPRCNTVVIATRHESHAGLTCRALAAGKNVFVEKPLAIDRVGLEAVRETLARVRENERGPRLMVGFNRRFAPLVCTMRSRLQSVRGPRVFAFMMNAGSVPPDHWTQDRDVGGGRIIGEACHLIDLMRFLCGERITRVAAAVASGGARGAVPPDTAVIVMSFADGSCGSVHYLANGHPGFPKERHEVFCGGRSLHLENFRELVGFGWGKRRRQKLRRQDKGQNACVEAFLAAIEAGEPSPIGPSELCEVAEFTIEAAELLEQGR